MATAIDGARYAQLKADGLSQREIAQRLGVPRSSLQVWIRRQEGVPARAAPAVTFVAVPEVQEILSIVKSLQERMTALEETRPIAPPAHTREGPRIPAMTRTRGNVQQWTLRLSHELIETIKRVAGDERLPPSHVVEEILWEWLERNAPTSEGR